jgi:hypothetical protein
MNQKPNFDLRAVVAMLLLVLGMGLIVWVSFFDSRGCAAACQPVSPLSTLDAINPNRTH